MGITNKTAKNMTSLLYMMIKNLKNKIITKRVVIGGVDALLASDDTVDMKYIQRITSLKERLENNVCSVQGGASRRRNAKRRGKNRRTRHKTCRRTRRS